MTDDIRQRAIALYDRFTHEGMERREFISRMVALVGSVGAAEALIGAIAASPAAAAVIPADDSRLTTSTMTLAGNYQAYVAQPRTRSLKPSDLGSGTRNRICRSGPRSVFHALKRAS